MNERDKKALELVHFVESEKGHLSRDFAIDPAKVHEIRRDPKKEKHYDPKTKMFRYVLAIGGADRNQAAHEYHDRVLHYPTKGGIFALYLNQIGTARLMLGISGSNRSNSRQEKDQQRLEDFKANLHGRKMLIVRGAFSSREEFVEALQHATRSRPGEHLFHPELPSLIVDAIVRDSLTFSGIALEKIGERGNRIAPNIPASRLIRLASNIAVKSGQELQGISDRIHDFSCSRNLSNISR